MPLKVAMYEKSLDHIRGRLEALKLDIDLITFDSNGQFIINGLPVPPEKVIVDYLWFSSHINADGIQKTAFDLALGCKRLSVLQTYNAGLDHPMYKKLSDKGVRICNSSAQGVAIAEYVMAQVLSVVHPVERQRELQRRKMWSITPFLEISKMNWVIIGFGPIGQEIAKRAKAFDAKILVVRRSKTFSENVDTMGVLSDLPSFLPEADVVILACPLNNETRGLANSDFFNVLKRGTILVNIARGPLIDDSAMIEALDSGIVSSAILDVFDEEPLPQTNPLWTNPKVRITSHTSFAGNGGRDRWDQLFLSNISRFVNGEPLAQEVNPKDI